MLLAVEVARSWPAPAGLPRAGEGEEMSQYFDDRTPCGGPLLRAEDAVGRAAAAPSHEPATFSLSDGSVAGLPLRDSEAGTRLWLEANSDRALANGCREPGACGDGAGVPLLADRGSGRPADGWELCHPRGPRHPGHSGAARMRLLAAAVLCLVFMAAEAAGGWLAGSVAVLTDAAHLLADAAGFGGSLLALTLAAGPRRPTPGSRLTFGWARAEPLAALASVALLWAATGAVGALAAGRLAAGGCAVDADAMLLVSALGVLVNVGMGAVLHGGCGHGHGHGAEYAPLPDTGAAADAGPTELPRNINVRAAVVHVLGDLVQSVGVFIAAVLIKFCPEARWADPVCSLLSCALVLATSAPVARDAALTLLEAAPPAPALQPAALAALLQAVPGVRAVKHLHVWSLTPGRAALTAHLLTGPDGDSVRVLRRAQRCLQSLSELEHITLQVAPAAPRLAAAL